MRKKVSSAWLDVLNKGTKLECFNKTTIILILKILNPSKMVNFWSISLCNVSYKLIAKMITNHFRWILYKCIDKGQSAFDLGRLIIDNVLMAYELLHTFFEKWSGKKGFTTLKLDMSKPYGCVE